MDSDKVMVMDAGCLKVIYLYLIFLQLSKHFNDAFVLYGIDHFEIGVR